MSKIKTAQYVSFSDIMNGLPKAMAIFNVADHTFSWGSNNLTLIDGQDIIGFFEEQVEQQSATDGEADECKKAIERLAALRGEGKQIIYVDLES
jgi:dihydropteroate synthase